jgi:hypothetical protein
MARWRAIEREFSRYLSKEKAFDFLQQNSESLCLKIRKKDLAKQFGSIAKKDAARMVVQMKSDGFQLDESSMSLHLVHRILVGMAADRHHVLNQNQP